MGMVCAASAAAMGVPVVDWGAVQAEAWAAMGPEVNVVDAPEVHAAQRKAWAAVVNQWVPVDGGYGAKAGYIPAAAVPVVEAWIAVAEVKADAAAAAAIDEGWC